MDLPVEEVMGPQLPTIGIGQRLDRALEMLHTAPALLVLSDGRPLSVLTRTDVLSYFDAQQRHELEESWAKNNSRSGWAFDTLAIHAGQAPDPSTGAVVPPISLSTTFAQSEVGVHLGYEYSRSGNPTRTAMETQIAALESARHGLAFASGLAAEDNVMRLLRQGQRVLLGNDAYGGTFRLISKVWSPLGFPWSAVDLGDLDALVADWPEDTGLVWLETPTNPLLTCFDIEAIAAIAHERGAHRRRRQHLRHAVSPAADHTRRRHRPPLGHQVPRRAQ